MRQEHARSHHGFRATQPAVTHGLRRFDNARLFGDAEETHQHIDLLRKPWRIHIQEFEECDGG